MNNPLAVALRGKGLRNLLRRGLNIVRRYSLTPRALERALELLVETLAPFECGATLPVVAVVAARHPALIRRYQARGIEFAIHGYRHVDHHELPAATQQTYLERALHCFAAAGIPLQGFRGPYLHANADTLAALRQHGLRYDSSQGLAWEVLEGLAGPDYRYVLHFYGARSASEYPSLPGLEEGLVRIPYSLPDDEALTHRLPLQTPAQRTELWLAILRRSYELGELFTVGLHPERTALFVEPLKAVLAEARRQQPAVWLARLEEIAAWWQARYAAQVTLTCAPTGDFTVTVAGPPGTTLLIRDLTPATPTQPWSAGYHRVSGLAVHGQAPVRPWIGLAPAAAPALGDFLRQQGYLTEPATGPQGYTCYLDQPAFTAEEQRPLLARLEAHQGPLVRLGRWPYGARSALAVTGDVDCLTLWDYLARFAGG